MTKISIKQRRQKIGTSYWASGYGRGRNKRNVYLIDGKCYAYHKQYACSRFDLLTDELDGYVPVNYTRGFGSFGALGVLESHELLITELEREIQ